MTSNWNECTSTGWRSTPLEKERSLEYLLHIQEEPAKVAQASVSDAPWMPPSQRMSRREETPGKTQDTLEWICHPAGLGTPWNRPEGLEGASGEIEVWASAKTAAPRGSESRMDFSLPESTDVFLPPSWCFRNRLCTFWAVRVSFVHPDISVLYWLSWSCWVGLRLPWRQ